MRKLTEEHKRRLSISQKKRYLLNGFPEEVKRKISETKKRRFSLSEIVVWNKGNKRPPFSEEWRKNLSSSLIGHKPYDNQIRATTYRNKTNNPMWNPEVVKKAVKNKDYKEIVRKGVLTREKNGTHLEYSKRMKKNNPMRIQEINDKVNKNPEIMKRRIQSLIKKPNKQETLLLDLIKKNNFPYKFVGNGEIIIETKNPDFINPHTKEIIEFFGDYWHTKKVRCYEETEEGRVEYFNNYGYRTLVIWEKELKSPEKVLEKINSFRLNHINPQ